jgi:predicted O-methyltransferase YrrM
MMCRPSPAGLRAEARIRRSRYSLIPRLDRVDDRWRAVDDYLVDRLIPPDPDLAAALAASDAAGLPAIQVAANQGMLLQLLAQIGGARRILEIGTLGGYSTIWLARALPPGGRLITLEAVPAHAEVARANLRRAGLADVVEVRLGLAADTLRELAAEPVDPFDFVFIDADKEGYPAYLDWTLRLSRPGTVIVADNVIRDGAVADLDDDDSRVVGVRRFLDELGRLPNVVATAVQTVGTKGYDGFAIARVVG